MPSKKKKKGKARRKKTNSAATSNDDNTLAVAAPITERPAQTAHQVLVYLGRSLMSGAGDQENYHCHHGLPSLNLTDQGCKAFLTTFFDEIEKHDNGGHVVNAAALAMQETLPNTPVASLTESTQKLINAWFVCIGVKCLLEVTTIDNGHDNDPAAAMALATFKLEDFCSAFFYESRKRNDDSMTVLTDDGRGKLVQYKEEVEGIENMLRMQAWLDILKQLRELDLQFNTVRLYRMDPLEVDYSEFIEGAAELGVYIIVPLTAASSNRGQRTKLSVAPISLEFWQTRLQLYLPIQSE
eukprot:scaffold442_cov109-Skeletonema_dohrnii-CCMP3373.AAC.4